MNKYHIKTGPDNMDLTAIHHFLSNESYWAKGIPLDTVRVSVENSFCAGVFDAKTQIGFARLVTDYSTFAYLADVYLLEQYRGKGLSKMLMSFLMNQPWINGLRRISLATSDAHLLYRQFGFDAPKSPGSLMEIKRDHIYEK